LYKTLARVSSYEAKTTPDPSGSGVFRRGEDRRGESTTPSRPERLEELLEVLLDVVALGD